MNSTTGRVNVRFFKILYKKNFKNSRLGVYDSVTEGAELLHVVVLAKAALEVIRFLDLKTEIGVSCIE